MTQTQNESLGPVPDALCSGIATELGLLVDQGLLNMGVNHHGETVYWPTERGAVELGMEMA